MALDVKFLTGSQADYNALLDVGLIEEKTFYYITNDSDGSKKLYLGGQELTNDGSVQEVYDILGISGNITDDNKISIDGETYDSIINYINDKTSGLPTQDNIASKIEKVANAEEDTIPVFNSDTGAKGLKSTNYYIPGSESTKANNTNTLATQAYVTEQVASGAVQYLGTISSTNDFKNIKTINNITSISKGDYIRIAVVIEDLPVDSTNTIKGFAGDLLIAEKNNPSYYVDGTNWSLIASHDTDTTYKADGTTLALTGNTFSVANGGVSTAQLANDAVETSKILNKAVTIGKLEEDLQTKIGKIDIDGSSITGHIEEQLSGYVKKDGNKVLSTNDYTTAEKNKLRGIDTGAQVNVIEKIQIDGADIEINDKTVNIPVSVPTDGQIIIGQTTLEIMDPNDYAKSADFNTLSSKVNDGVKGLDATNTLAKNAQTAAEAAQATANSKIDSTKAQTIAEAAASSVRGDTKATVADCVQAINKIYDGTTATKDLVNQIEYNVKSVYNVQQNLVEQLQWNQIISINISFEDDTADDLIVYIGGQTWNEWIYSNFNKEDYNIYVASGETVIRRKLNNIDYFLTESGSMVRINNKIYKDKEYIWATNQSGSDEEEEGGGDSGIGDNRTDDIINPLELYDGTIANGTVLTTSSTSDGIIDIDYSQGTNSSNPPKYYSGKIRLYRGNTLTLTSDNGLIYSVDFEFANSRGSNLSSDYYANGTWNEISDTRREWKAPSGGVSSITFTHTGTEEEGKPIEIVWYKIVYQY